MQKTRGMCTCVVTQYTESLNGWLPNLPQCPKLRRKHLLSQNNASVSATPCSQCGHNLFGQLTQEQRYEALQMVSSCTLQTSSTDRFLIVLAWTKSTTIGPSTVHNILVLLDLMSFCRDIA